MAESALVEVDLTQRSRGGRIWQPVPDVGLAVQNGRMFMGEQPPHERLKQKWPGRQREPAILAGQHLGGHFPDWIAATELVHGG